MKHVCGDVRIHTRSDGYVAVEFRNAASARAWCRSLLALEEPWRVAVFGPHDNHDEAEAVAKAIRAASDWEEAADGAV